VRRARLDAGRRQPDGAGGACPDHQRRRAARKLSARLGGCSEGEAADSIQRLLVNNRPRQLGFSRDVIASYTVLWLVTRFFLVIKPSLSRAADGASPPRGSRAAADPSQSACFTGGCRCRISRSAGTAEKVAAGLHRAAHLFPGSASFRPPLVSQGAWLRCDGPLHGGEVCAVGVGLAADARRAGVGHPGGTGRRRRLRRQRNGGGAIAAAAATGVPAPRASRSHRRSSVPGRPACFLYSLPAALLR